MEHSKQLLQLRQRRAFRVRKRVRGTTERPRLSVVRSHKHISVQVIDDLSGKTLGRRLDARQELVRQVEVGRQRKCRPGSRQSDRRAGDRRRHQGGVLRSRAVPLSRSRGCLGQRGARRRIEFLREATSMSAGTSERSQRGGASDRGGDEVNAAAVERGQRGPTRPAR